MKNLRILLALLLFPLVSNAWNAEGHNTCGAVAYYYMKKNSPATISKVVLALKQHPWYNTEWKNKLTGLTGEKLDVALFMLASTYPDDARKDEALGGGEKKKWHYVDYPFVPAGEKVKAAAPEKPNAEIKINELLTTLKTTKNPAQKAIDLCWLFHLIEDVHQPLHTIAMYDRDHPKGDRGGNDTYILLDGEVKGVALHGLWDGMVDGSFREIPALAKALVNNTSYSDATLPDLKNNPNVNDWIKNESYVLAKQFVYMNGKINGVDNNPYPAPNGYVIAARNMCERRVVLAGIRVAQKLAGLF